MKKFNIINVLPFLLLTACSSGPADKPAPASITTPENLLVTGIQHYNNNDYTGARKSFNKALFHYRSIDHRLGIADSRLNLAMTAMAVNDTTTSEHQLQLAEKIIRSDNMIGLEEHLSILKSSLSIKQNNLDAAQNHLNSALSSKKPSIQLAALKSRTIIAFERNDSDKQAWLDKYRKLQIAHPEKKTHLARILRFDATLATSDKVKQNKLNQSLEISRTLADRPAIAATLTQWADDDIQKSNLSSAEDKLRRALFIRSQIGDNKNTLFLLEKLNKVYSATNSDKLSSTRLWIERLRNNNDSNISQLYLDFD